MAKFHPNNYVKSTPVFWRKMGDSILIMGTTLTATFAGMEIHKEWIIAAAFFTALGKMITNLFSEDNKPNNEQENSDQGTQDVA